MNVLYSAGTEVTIEANDHERQILVGGLKKFIEDTASDDSKHELASVMRDNLQR
jgi:hypothetical protein